MPTDTTDRIETGRSWRDLPSQPPLESPDRRPAGVAMSPTIEAPRHLPWARIGIGIAALVIGVTVGLWAPWASEGATEILPQSAEQLPEQIVPENRDDLTPVVPAPDADPEIVPDGFGSAEQFFDQLPDSFRNQLPPGFFEDPPGAEGFETPGLITLDGLPDGYQIRSNVYSGTNAQASQRLRLLGPDGSVDVQAIRGPDVALPGDGESHRIGEIDGRIRQTSSSTTISWMIEDDLLITIEASANVPIATLDAIAATAEVAP